jgi:hypothetical protein
MTRAVTVRLDAADNAALEEQAHQLRIRLGALARILIHPGLRGNVTGSDNARAALNRLVQRSQQHASADAVKLVADEGLGLHR